MAHRRLTTVWIREKHTAEVRLFTGKLSGILEQIFNHAKFTKFTCRLVFWPQTWTTWGWTLSWRVEGGCLATQVEGLGDGQVDGSSMAMVVQ